ncbi:unnamed protein product [Auanema sp. JU1783]|nr:unnamed protein product [Auanema sp. JU1783]
MIEEYPKIICDKINCDQQRARLRIGASYTIFIERKRLISGIDEGTHNNYKFIVMELLGANLSRIRKLLANWRFKSNIVVKIGICILDALNIVHNIGYTHSDVKPSNMCIGQGEKVRLSLVDFGLSRKIDRVSSYAKFRGTRKYCSINAHQQIAHAPSDDIASLFYSLIELSEGVLPWSSLHEKNDICFQKRMLTKETVFKYQSPKLWLFYVDGYENCSDRFELDYSLLLKNLESCLDDPKCSSITTEDWKYLNNR